ncbi:RNA polymerase sigma-70 factor [Macellibacteroides fermentans]|uniref:RNA polymerase sigma-70 factor (ECF subfamily) n=1 Tax=Macellibacteroides fermentans TaxID=879969 RepID=A0A8E1ZYD1_9PORP|nr:RNA polymerase sigma-70 factor [Macellibacteroides fermentans]NYI50777.1 RNA polymerase sigma-70 factor (ECF subfamily) [Macellibacteroides fermentans]
MKKQEQIIVDLLKQGDEKAYKYLYDEHYVLLCKMANEFVRDVFMAENIVGDTLFHVWEIRETLEINISIRSYLVRAVRNRCINYLNIKREQWEEGFTTIEENGDSIMHPNLFSDAYPLASLLEKELEEEIRQAINRLPDECRAVFIKSRFEEKTYECIARELGISVNTVKYHMKMALSRLNADLSKYLLLLLIAFRQIN